MSVQGKTFVAGHAGLVGSAIVRRLEAAGARALLTATRGELDLRNQAAVNAWFEANHPENVFLVAGTVGGIMANATRPAEFIYDNVMIASNVVHAAHVFGVDKLLYLGSSCMYPRVCPQPMKEEYLLTGPLEPTSEPYAVAKIAGMKLCESYRRQYGSKFITAIPTGVYGPHDSFDPEAAHVLPALMRRFHEARQNGQGEVVIWGSGHARREFLHVDDLADACVYVMDHYDDPAPLNIGTGEEVSVRELAEALRDVIHPGADLTFDTSKPDGAPRKLLDVSRLHAAGWRHRVGLREGLQDTYRWFSANV